VRANAVRSLFWKESRQIARNRTALLTATFLPFIILFFAPIQLLVQFRLAPFSPEGDERFPVPGLADITEPSQLLVGFVYPVLFVVGGLLLPSVTTTYAIIAERERRTLELLISLPVSVAEILAAKLLTVLAVTAMVGLPYVAAIVTLLLVIGIADAPAVLALLATFAAAVVCATAISLLLTLLARDFRTANNLNGVLLGPLLVVTVVTLLAVPGPAKTYVLSLVLLIAGAGALVVTRRWISYERYLE
jgi:ABC-type transport system involved in multi-copper enzyme maturation permease subunit